jgi:hypothetical protein
MRHRILTCKDHPELRWSTKDCAWTDGGYNGSRSLFFTGVSRGRMYNDGSGLDCSMLVEHRDADGNITSTEFVRECDCPTSNLVLAPEDAQVAS